MSILAFQMPEKISMEKGDDFRGYFTFKPLEKGYGVTIGNALRRMLLSSLEGYAITSFKIPNVLHEFTHVDGVIEDVSNIVLNLKMVRFKKISDDVETKTTITLKGKKQFLAKDIEKFVSSYKVLNPELVICNMEENMELNIELNIGKGRGYFPVEERKQENKEIGEVLIDAIFTPIKNVKYSVENTRVEQKTDFEKLVLDVETDGSVHPEEAIKEAANVLIRHFLLCSDKTMVLEDPDQEEYEAVDEELLHMRKLLKTPLEDLALSVRASNCLKAANIKTLGELAQLNINDMMKFRNFGKKSLTELEKLIASKNLEFGMDISKYKLDEE